MSRSLFSIPFLMILVTGILAVVLPFSTSLSGQTTARKSSGNENNPGITVNALYDSKLPFIREEYKGYVRNQESGNQEEAQHELEETRMGLETALKNFRSIKSYIASRDQDKAQRIESNLKKLKTAINETKSVERIQSLINHIRSDLKPFRASGNSPSDQYLNKIGNIDSLLQAETSPENSDYRIGVFTTEPQTLHGSATDTENDPDSNGFYLGVVLRQKRSKKFLPGATVKAIIRGRDRTRKFTLKELWGAPQPSTPGPFHHYGINVPESISVSPDSSVEISIGAPRYGRHQEARFVFLNDASARFPVKTTTEKGMPMFDGDSPEPYPDDFQQGLNIQKARGECTKTMKTDQYWIGYIAEPEEPFWKQTDNGLKKVSPQSDTGNHVEIVLLEANSYEPIPQMNIQLTYKKDGNTVKKIQLEPLLAEFYHYGTNTELNPGTYTVDVSIHPGALYTLRDGVLPSVKKTFEWTKE